MRSVNVLHLAYISLTWKQKLCKRLLVYQKRFHTGLTVAFTTHRLVFLLKRCQYIWCFLLFISQSLFLTAEEEVHLRLSPLMFIQAQYKQLTAGLWQLILICEDGLKKLNSYVCYYMYPPRRLNANFRHLIIFKGYLWKRAAAGGSDCSISVSSSSNMLLNRCDPFKNSTNASCGM